MRRQVKRVLALSTLSMAMFTASQMVAPAAYARPSYNCGFPFIHVSHSIADDITDNGGTCTKNPN